MELASTSDSMITESPNLISECNKEPSGSLKRFVFRLEGFLEKGNLLIFVINPQVTLGDIDQHLVASRARPWFWIIFLLRKFLKSGLNHFFDCITFSMLA